MPSQAPSLPGRGGSTRSPAAARRWNLHRPLSTLALLSTACSRQGDLTVRPPKMACAPFSNPVPKARFEEVKPKLRFVKKLSICAKPKSLGQGFGWHGSMPNQAVNVALDGEVIKSQVMASISARVSSCVLTKDEFLAAAEALPEAVTRALVRRAQVRTFSTGSCGWHAHTEKAVKVSVAGSDVLVVVNFQAVLRGTKLESGDASAGLEGHGYEGAPKMLGASVRVGRKRTLQGGPDEDDAPLLKLPARANPGLLRGAGAAHGRAADGSIEYEELLLSMAKARAKHGLLNLQDAVAMWESAVAAAPLPPVHAWSWVRRLAAWAWGGAGKKDHHVITDVQRRTFEYVMRTYGMDQAADTFLAAKLGRDLSASLLAQSRLPCINADGAGLPVRKAAGTFTPVFYNPGDAGLGPLAHTLESASRTLDVAVFAITDDRLTQILIGLHQKGVKVRIIADNLMETAAATSDLPKLRKAGIEVRVDQSRMHMHHKFAVVDGKICISGSLNWTTGALKNNRENIIISRCKRIATTFAAEFARLWIAFSPAAGHDGSRAPDGTWADNRIALFFPDKDDANFKTLVAEVQSAQATLDVAMFTLTVAELKAAMKDAHARGVRVRVIMDDRQAAAIAKGAHLEELRAAGIEVRTDHSYANMHHKFCVIDGRTVCNGSLNWTRQAEDGNYEDVIVFREELELARSFVQEFDRLWAEFAPH